MDQQPPRCLRRPGVDDVAGADAAELAGAVRACRSPARGGHHRHHRPAKRACEETTHNAENAEPAERILGVFPRALRVLRSTCPPSGGPSRSRVKDAPAAAASIPLPAARRSPGLLADYVALTKPRLNCLVVATSAAGYYLGGRGSTDVMAMTQAVAGTALAAGGAAVLNQLFERETDALMRRTRLRPLPDGRVAPADARIFGIALSLAGLLLLAARANWLAAGLALATILVYLIVYTPMKRRTPLSTLVGAVPGALPVLIGWTASHGSVALGGATLFTIVFLWQIPHFMAIAWLYRDDYGKGSRGCIATITARRASRCCPSSTRRDDGQAARPCGMRRRWCRSASRRRSPVSPARSTSCRRSCLASRCSFWPFDLPQRETTVRRAPCSSAPSRICRSSGS
ncbi:MAG: protoheme IX farnesyltransferase [Acidobacteria bacterium]|nr:MAG: protoheme IX farnesyltransferase [Acidobacteriota bacterium]